ncbi:hypothetical protein NW759_016719 [Fusarium solani]|nr:hypothetical protein NW759_016719 [Fusarium solani]
MTASLEALTCCDLIDLNSLCAGTSAPMNGPSGRVAVTVLVSYSDVILARSSAVEPNANIDQSRGVSDVVAAVRGWRFIFPVAHATIPQRRLLSRELVICGGRSPLFGIALCIFCGPSEQLDII